MSSSHDRASSPDRYSSDGIYLSDTDGEEEQTVEFKVRSSDASSGSEPLASVRRTEANKFHTEPPRASSKTRTARHESPPRSKSPKSKTQRSKDDLPGGIVIYTAKTCSSLPCLRKTVEMLKPAELATSLEAGEAIVVDVRDFDYFYIGHIPSSRHVPGERFQELFPSLVYELGRQRKKIVFCCTEGHVRDEYCATKFKRAVKATCFTPGTCLVYRLQGGMVGWNKFCEETGFKEGLRQATQMQLLDCFQTDHPGSSLEKRTATKTVTFASSDPCLPAVSRHKDATPESVIKATSSNLPLVRRPSIVKTKLLRVGPDSKDRLQAKEPMVYKTYSMGVLPTMLENEGDERLNNPPKMPVPEQSESIGALPSVEESKVRPISPAELNELLQARQVQIVDVRDLDFYMGHIPDAIHAPDSVFEEQLPALVHELGISDKSVVFHCMQCHIRGPRCANMFLRVAEERYPQSHCSVFYLKGGFQAWQRFCWSFSISEGVVHSSTVDALHPML